MSEGVRVRRPLLGNRVRTADRSAGRGARWVLAGPALGTVPIFALIGFALGCVGAAVACWRFITKFLAQMDEDDRNDAAPRGPQANAERE